MKKVIKQCVGIDCSKDTLDVSVSFLQEDFQFTVHATEIFDNNHKGFNRLMKWMKKLRLKELPCQVIMEATGVYHESLAYILVEKGFEIAIVLPNKIRNYCRSTDVRTVTDKISAKQIAEFGLVKNLDNWEKPNEVFRIMKQLSRERLQLLKVKTMTLNQMHAHQYSALVGPRIKQRLTQRIKFLEKQIKQIENDVEAIVNEYPWLREKIRKICTIKGVGLTTVATIVAETNGFNLIRNTSQLVCYAGYDIVVKQSGISVNSKPRISHKGNKYIRRALHFPALTAVKHDASFANFYNRLFEKQKIKMKGYVAVQRKLLILIYTLWKNNTEYDPAYQSFAHKCLEQPLKAALTELDQVRS